MDDTIIAVPAYGRNYTDKESLLQDWIDGKDFRIARGPYFSIRDADRCKQLGFGKVLFMTASALRVEVPL